MNATIKRRLAILLCLAMVLALLPVSALAFSEETKTIYFDNSAKKWTNVNAYYWNSAESNGWPGTAMTQVDDTTWSVEVPVDAVNIIFNNGSGAQTADLTVPTDDKNIHNGNAWGVYGGGFEEVEMETVYVDLAATGWSNVNAYVWLSTGGPVNGSWPGDAMTLVEGSIYSVSIVAGSANMVIFNNGSGNQTSDLAWPGDGMIWNGSEFVPYEGYGQDVPEETTTEPGVSEEPSEPVEPPVTTFVAYCINSEGWTNLTAYAWNDSSDNLWPGEAMTLTEETVNGYEIYKIELASTYTSVIFNNNGYGLQTTDLAAQAGYYDLATKTWYESLEDVPAVDPLATDAVLMGSFNDWSGTDFRLLAADERIAYVSVELSAGTAYEFKIVRGNSWLSCDCNITGDAAGLVFDAGVANNAVMTAAADGTYVFAYNLDTNELSITYPEAPVVENPTKVSGVTVAGTDCYSFDVSWDAIPGAQKYWVFVDGAIYHSTTGTSLTVANRKPDTEYQFYVTALLADGTILAAKDADVLSCATAGYGLSIDTAATEDSITVNWNANGATKTWVYVGTDPENLTIYHSSTTDSMVIANRKPGTTYYVQLTHLIDGKIVANDEIVEVTTSEKVLPKAEYSITDGVLEVNWDAYGDSWKYWVFVNYGEKTSIYSFTSAGEAFVLTLKGEAESIAMKGVNSEGMYDYDTVLAE